MRVTYDMPADFKVGDIVECRFSEVTWADQRYLAARHYLKDGSLASARVDLIEDIKRQDGRTTITCFRSFGRRQCRSAAIGWRGRSLA
jgi:hypothetical protein